MEKNYKTPPVTWLKMTDYTHGWLQHALGGAARICDQRVLCIQHLPGIKPLLRMETAEDMMEKGPAGGAMSSTRRNCLLAGMDLDPSVIEREYGITAAQMELYVPVECPGMCMTRNGVLRPWTLDVCFGKEQATALQKLLRNEFWAAVGEYDREYAARMGGRHYPARDMIEEFCAETGTSDIYVDAIRREWQRRAKRAKSRGLE